MNAPALALLDQRATQLGYAKSLLQDFITAADAEPDQRDVFMKYAVARARRELAADGKLS